MEESGGEPNSGGDAKPIKKSFSKAPIIYFLFESVMMSFVGLINHLLYDFLNIGTLLFWIVTISSIILYIICAYRTPGFVLTNIYKIDTDLSMNTEPKKDENIIIHKGGIGKRKLNPRNQLIRINHGRNKSGKYSKTTVEGNCVLDNIGKEGCFSEESAPPKQDELAPEGEVIQSEEGEIIEGISTEKDERLSPSDMATPNICLPTAEISLSYLDPEFKTSVGNLLREEGDLSIYSSDYTIKNQKVFQTPQAPKVMAAEKYKKDNLTDFAIPGVREESNKNINRISHTDKYPERRQFTSYLDLEKNIGDVKITDVETKIEKSDNEKRLFMQGKTFSDAASISNIPIIVDDNNENKTEENESNYDDNSAVPQISIDIQDEVVEEEEKVEPNTISDKIEVELRYCTICHIEQPLRCKHCSECNHCVATFDHHCTWLGNCIGEKNRLYFLLYTIFEFLHTFIAIIFVSLAFSSENGFVQIMYYNWYKALLFIIIFYFLFMLLALVVFHIYLAIHNLTTWENLSWEKISYLAQWPMLFGSPFDKGIKYNMKLFLCILPKFPLYIWRMPKILPKDKKSSRTVIIWGKCWNALCNR